MLATQVTQPGGQLCASGATWWPNVEPMVAKFATYVKFWVRCAWELLLIRWWHDLIFSLSRFFPFPFFPFFFRFSDVFDFLSLGFSFLFFLGSSSYFCIFPFSREWRSKSSSSDGLLILYIASPPDHPRWVKPECWLQDTAGGDVWTKYQVQSFLQGQLMEVLFAKHSKHCSNWSIDELPSGRIAGVIFCQHTGWFF